MNIDKKTCINMGIVVFLLYLAIHYWTVWSACSTSFWRQRER